MPTECSNKSLHHNTKSMRLTFYNTAGLVIRCVVYWSIRHFIDGIDYISCTADTILTPIVPLRVGAIEILITKVPDCRPNSLTPSPLYLSPLPPPSMFN